MFTVYILQSTKTKRYYIGQTANLEKRIQRHNSNQTKSLKYRGPYNVIYTEIFSTRSEAYRREQEIKSYKSGNQFKNLLK